MSCVLAIVALEVPLALQLRTARRRRGALAGDEPGRRGRGHGRRAARARRRGARSTGWSARAAARVRGRVVIVDRRGRLIADSAGAAALGADYGDRPEIAAALKGRGFQDTRAAARRCAPRSSRPRPR